MCKIKGSYLTAEIVHVPLWIVLFPRHLLRKSLNSVPIPSAVHNTWISAHHCDYDYYLHCLVRPCLFGRTVHLLADTVLLESNNKRRLHLLQYILVGHWNYGNSHRPHYILFTLTRNHEAATLAAKEIVTWSYIFTGWLVRVLASHDN